MIKRSLLSSSLGNVLEWYDFGLFVTFAPLFSRLFFPSQQAGALIATFSLFALGFICRPLGALVFGFLGDRRGRATTLRLSILMISLPTFLIAFLPTYNMAGYFAPVMLTLIRMWQGISLGGEYSGNLVYLAESAPKHLRATFTSLAGTGSNLGILLATVIGTACTHWMPEKILEQWGWRLPYLISGAFSMLIWMTRLKLTETPAFTHLRQKHKVVINPIRFVFQNNLRDMLITLGIVSLGSTFYYFVFVWIPAMLTIERHFPSVWVSGLFSVLYFSMLILVPAAGYLCDHTGRRKLFLLIASLVVLLAWPMLALIQEASFLQVGLMLFILTIISSLEQATSSVMVVENFPLPARYTGLSLSYNIGNGFLGGTLPAVSAGLSENVHFLAVPALYVSACALVSGMVVFFFVRETRGKSIEIMH